MPYKPQCCLSSLKVIPTPCVTIIATPNNLLCLWSVDSFSASQLFFSQWLGSWNFIASLPYWKKKIKSAILNKMLWTHFWPFKLFQLFFTSGLDHGTLKLISLTAKLQNTILRKCSLMFFKVFRSNIKYYKVWYIKQGGWELWKITCSLSSQVNKKTMASNKYQFCISV